MSILVTLLVVLVIACLVYWAAHRIAGAFGLPPPLLVLIDVVIVIAVVVYVLRVAGLWPG